MQFVDLLPSKSPPTEPLPLETRIRPKRLQSAEHAEYAERDGLFPGIKVVMFRVFRVFRGPLPSLCVRPGRVDLSIYFCYGTMP